MQIRRNYVESKLVIPSSDDTSGDVDISSLAFGAILLPASLTGSALTPQVTIFEDDDIDFPNLWTWGAPYDETETVVSDITFSASRLLFLHPAIFGFRRLRLKSGSTESAAREILFFGKG